MRTALAGFAAWLAMLIGYSIPWSLFVQPPPQGEDWFFHALGAIVWIALFVSLFSIPVTGCALVLTEMQARRTASRRRRLALRALPWFPISAVFVCFQLSANRQWWLHSVGCAFAGAFVASAVYVFLAPDIHRETITHNVA
jgi:H+/Cl- antiporter ClcA